MTRLQEEALIEALKEKKLTDTPKHFPAVDPKAKVLPLRDGSDNSNTQFAVMALGTALKHDLPLKFSVALAEARFRTSAHPTGWAYHYRPGGGGGYGAMTAGALIALCLGRASASDEKAPARDEQITTGLRALAQHMADPLGMGAGPDFGPRGTLHFYFLWSVERVGILCDLQTLGGKDWYRWGVDLLLPAQRKDGSWLGRGNGGNAPVVDTSMALLFLKRADLLPDVRKSLLNRVVISDPAQDPVKPAKSESKDGKPAGKEAIGKSSVARSSDELRLILNLGDVKLKEATGLPVKVKGPAAYRIKGVRGVDVELRVSHDGESRETQLVVLTLTLEQTGDFERTLYLQTDIPGRADVPIQVRARAVEGK